MASNQTEHVRPLAAIVIAVLCVVTWVDVAALPPRVELEARVRASDGAIAIAPGAVLRTGDEVRLKITPWSDGHLYVINLGSSGTATLLHPFVENAARDAHSTGVSAPVQAGEDVLIPADGGFLPLDDHTGREMIVAFVAEQPVAALTRLMFQMEGLNDDPRAARDVLVSAGFELAHVSFGHVAENPEVAPAQAPVVNSPESAASHAVVSATESDNNVNQNPPAASGEQGVLGGLGGRIAQFTGTSAGPAREPSHAPTEPTRQVAVERAAPAPAPVTVAAESSPSADSESGFGSVLSSLFGIDRDEAPAAVVALQPEQEPRPARTFALPAERPEPQQLKPRELASESPPAAQASVPEPSALPHIVPGGDEKFSATATGRMIESLPPTSPLDEPNATVAPAPVTELEPAVQAAEKPTATIDTDVVVINVTDSAPETGSWFSGLAALFSGEQSGASQTPASDQSPRNITAEREPNIERRLDGAGREVVVLEGLPTRERANSGDQEVLSGSGSRIRALLDGPEAQNESNSQLAAVSVASGESAKATPPSTLEMPQSVALPGAVPVQSRKRTMVELAVVDLNSASGVAAAVVLVVTPQGNTSGVLVDRDGHILTNWHTVHNFDAVVVMFKQAGGSLPAHDSLVRARVVAHSKFADLALLKAESIPAAIEPVTIAAKVEAQSGVPIHAIGPAGGRDSNGQWQHAVANLNRVRRGSSWYSTQRVLHRADIIRATMNPVQDFAGAPLFNNQLELIGLGAMVREEKGEIVGISASTIRVFLANSSS